MKTVLSWMLLFPGLLFSMSLFGCASGANMRNAEINVTLPPGVTTVATVDAQGKGVPAIVVNIGNTTREVTVETARGVDVALPAGVGAAGL